MLEWKIFRVELNSQVDVKTKACREYVFQQF